VLILSTTQLMIITIQWDITSLMAYIHNGQHLQKQFHLPKGIGENTLLQHKSAMKDVERAFKVLQARFAIVCGPARFFYPETLNDIMIACVILHNMIVEDERDNNGEEDFEYEQFNQPLEPVTSGPTNDFMEFIQSHHCIRDTETHSQLQLDLVEHLWQLYREA
jgi:hypothetical protein